MKNLLIKILLLVYIFSFFNIIWNTYAADSSTWSWILIKVTEKIPWASCTEIKSDWTAWKVKEWETQMYECSVAKWFASVTEMLWKIIKYFTYIAALWWVLFIIINGILYSMWWIDQWMKDEAKKRIGWTLTWLVLLFLSWMILNLVAPWIYK